MSSPQRITRVTATPVRVPIPRQRINCPQFSHETLNRKPNGDWGGEYFGDVPFYVVKVEGGGGPAGWGCTPRNRDPALLTAAAQRMLGRELSQIRPDDDPTLDVYLRGVHTAALVWRALRENQPLHALFGPKRRDRVKISEWSGFHTPEGAALVTRAAKDEGFTSYKIKASMEIDAPGIARAVRDACGDDFELVIDPNGRWETLGNTLERARAIAAVNRRVYLEDPVYGPEALRVLAEVRRRAGVGGIKTVGSPEQAQQAVALKAVDAFNISTAWPLALRTSAVAAEHRVPFWVGSSCESGIADLAVLHFAVTQPMFTFGCEVAGHRVREHHLLREPIRYESGYAIVPDAPGLGIDVDEDAIERYRVGDPIVVE